MSITSLVVALVLFCIAYFVIQRLVPAEFKQLAMIVLIGAAVIWVVTHLNALLHCCTT